jgi:manganese efflux pump family protein
MMNIIEILLTGIVLSLDSFSAAIAMGSRPHSRKIAWQFALTSGSSEALVALLGALAGKTLVRYFSAIDHWVAFFILLGVALHMACEGIEQLKKSKQNEKKDENEKELSFHHFSKVILVSLATSLDAFGIGVGLGTTGEKIAPYIFSIAFFAFIATLLGLSFAKKIPKQYAPIMTLFGAGVLAIMAFQMLRI